MDSDGRSGRGLEPLSAARELRMMTQVGLLRCGPYRAIQDPTLGDIAETFDSVNLVQGCKRGQRKKMAVGGVGPQAIPGGEPESLGTDSR